MKKADYTWGTTADGGLVLRVSLLINGETLVAESAVGHRGEFNPLYPVAVKHRLEQQIIRGISERVFT